MLEELQIVKHVCRKDLKVIEQCKMIGIPEEDMHTVHCNP
jgi:primary-amine oxidase